MCQHLLRHITHVQVRNFTPFPARDAFASALTQPSEQSQFTPYGSLSDDLDVALARKRTRRLSSASSVTVKSQGLEDPTNEESQAVGPGLLGDQRVRKRTVSRVSAREFPTGMSSGSHPPLSGTGTASKTNYPRSLPLTSSTSGKGMVPTATLWQSHTQSTLEKVLQSRLVETFITIDVPSTLKPSSSPAKPSTSSRDRRPSPRASPASKSKPYSTQSSPSRSNLSIREEQIAKRHSRAGTTAPTDGLAPAPVSPSRRGVTSPAKSNGYTSKSASQVKSDPETRTVPDFVSAIHRPSTNPQFALDANDFPKWTDPSASHMTVQLWAKLRPDPPCVLVNDKGQGKVSDEVDTWDLQWRMTVKWDICLNDLVPLPEDEVSTL
jgi:hypothetical protein